MTATVTYPSLQGRPALHFARLTGLPVPPEADDDPDRFRVTVSDPVCLHAACTAAHLANLLPGPEAGEVAAEFLRRLGLSRRQFGSWGQVARTLGDLISALN